MCLISVLMDDTISFRFRLLFASNFSVKVVVDMSVISVTCEDSEVFVVCFSVSLRFYLSLDGLVSFLLLSHTRLLLVFSVIMREDPSLFRCILSRRLLACSRTQWILDGFVCWRYVQVVSQVQPAYPLPSWSCRCLVVLDFLTFSLSVLIIFR